VGALPTLGRIEPVPVLELKIVFREACITGIHQIWCLLIDIHSIAFHVKFEDRLSTSVLRNRATRCKKVQLYKSKSFQKSQTCSNPAHPLYFTLGELVHVRDPKLTET
jgi:hypothetical protein